MAGLRRALWLAIASCMGLTLAGASGSTTDTSVFDRDVVVIGGTSGSGTRAVAVLLAQLGVDVVYEHRTPGGGKPPFDTPSLSFLEPSAFLLAAELAAKGGDVCAVVGDGTPQAARKRAVFESLHALAAAGDLSSDTNFGRLRYVHEWLHSQAGAAAAMKPGSAGRAFISKLLHSGGADEEEERWAAWGDDSRGRGRGRERRGRQLRSKVGAQYPAAGIAMKQAKDAWAAADAAAARNGTAGVHAARHRSRVGAGARHAAQLWPTLDSVHYCRDITNASCPWGFKSPAALLSVGEYARLFGPRLHFVHVVRDVRDMLAPRSHSFIQARKFYDAMFPRSNSSEDSCTMLAHADESAAHAILRGGGHKTTCSDDQLAQLRVVRLWARANLQAKSCATALGGAGTAGSSGTGGGGGDAGSGGMRYYVFRVEDFVFGRVGGADSTEGVPDVLLELLADLGLFMDPDEVDDAVWRTFSVPLSSGVRGSLADRYEQYRDGGFKRGGAYQPKRKFSQAVECAAHEALGAFGYEQLLHANTTCHLDKRVGWL